MNIHLFLVLIERGIITSGTTLYAVAKKCNEVVRTIGRRKPANYFYRSHVKTQNDFLITGVDEDTLQPAQFKASDITVIDGMEVTRLAGIYGLSEEGEPIKMASRRGRRPKVAGIDNDTDDTDDYDDFEDDCAVG